MCFDFLYNFCLETVLILRRTERDMIIYVYWSSCKVPVILVRFERNVHFLNRFSKKYSNIKFHKNPSSGSCVVPFGRTERQTDRQTDRHDEASRRFPQILPTRLETVTKPAERSTLPTLKYCLISVDIPKH
jgi:hypothetical protein